MHGGKSLHEGVSWLTKKKKNNGRWFFGEPPPSVANETNKGTTGAEDVLWQLNKAKEIREVGCFMPRWWGGLFG